MKNGIIFPFKTTWRARLDLEYLDETSGRKIAARQGAKTEVKVDQADHTAIGKNLRQFADYASKETIGQVHAGGFLHHSIIENPDGTFSSPKGLTNTERKHRISEAWFNHLKKWTSTAKNPVIQHRLVFTMSTPFHDKLVAAGLNPDTVLLNTLRKTMRDFQEKFHPGDSIGYAYGLHHDTDNLHVHVALCPRTKKGAYVGCSKSRSRTSQNLNQIDFLMRCFERENLQWEKRLSEPQKMKETIQKRLDSDRLLMVPRLSLSQMAALTQQRTLAASRLQFSYRSILDMEAALQRKRKAIRTRKVLRAIPRLLGNRRSSTSKVLGKVVSTFDQLSFRELQIKLCQQKLAYRAEHQKYTQRYGSKSHAYHSPKIPSSTNWQKL